MLDIELHLKKLIANAFATLGVEMLEDNIVIERSKEKAHGDYATNAAMQMARVLKRNPREIAQSIVSNINDASIEKIEIAGPGFINFFIRQESLNSIVELIINKGENFGDSTHGNNTRINVEFVSANPTGDLHLGHALRIPENQIVLSE